MNITSNDEEIISIETWRKNNPFFIKKIKAKGLLSRYDVEWDLKDINILVGRNGTGKSTLISLIELALSKDINKSLKEKARSVVDKFEKFTLTYNNDKEETIFIEKPNEIKSLIDNLSKVFNEKNFSKGNVKQLSEITNKLNSLQERFENLNLDDSDILFNGRSQVRQKGNDTQLNDYNTIYDHINTSFISTFDMLLLSKEDFDKFQGKGLTELDTLLIESIIAYKGNIIKLNNNAKFESKVNKKKNDKPKNSIRFNADLLNQAEEKLKNFREIISLFFCDEEKQIEISDSGDFNVFQGNTKYDLTTLSSGEKQILIILLDVFNKSLEKPCIIIMDEPEISLHVQWQKMLVDALTKIVPQSQIIIASHSPTLVVSGGVNNYTDIKDIRKLAQGLQG